MPEDTFGIPIKVIYGLIMVLVVLGITVAVAFLRSEDAGKFISDILGILNSWGR